MVDMGNYWVVFQGVTRDTDIDAVKAEMTETYGLRAEDIEHMFSGQPVIIRRHASIEQAAALKEAIGEIGGICWFEPDEGDPSAYSDRRQHADRRSEGGDQPPQEERRQSPGRRFEDIPS